MTAGTVVITGGILATAILLCIIAVLCYCRLQYYCCKNNGSETDSVSQTHVSCNACSAAGLDGAALTPLSLSPEPPPPPSSSSSHAAPFPPPPHTYCPTCSPYDSPFYIRTADETRNGGERITYMPTYYENQALAFPPLALPPPLHAGSLLSDGRRAQRHHHPAAAAADFYTNTHAISTEV